MLLISLLCLICLSCGQTYRPVAYPVPSNPPDPRGTHFVYMLARNGNFNPGGGTKIDVSGDTNVGADVSAADPAHIALLPDSSAAFIANRGSDTVYRYSLTPINGAGVSFTFTNTVPLPPNSRPTFLATTQTNRMYVANLGNGAGNPGPSVAVIEVNSSTVSHTVPVGNKPISLVETPDGQFVYSLNEADNTVSVISTVDFSVVATPNVGNSPVWAVARSDSKRVYVLNQGDGTISVIDPTALPQAVIQTVTLKDANGGPVTGANYMFYSSKLERLYVTDPTANVVDVFDVSGSLDKSVGAPVLLKADSTVLNVTNSENGSMPSLTAITPVSVTVLPDGSGAFAVGYVLRTGTVVDVPTAVLPNPIPSHQGPVIDSYLMAISTADNSVNSATLLDPYVSVTSPDGKTVTITSSSTPVDTTNQTGTNATGCGDAFDPTNTSQSGVRFRLSIAAAGDSSRVYVANCDLGGTQVISTQATLTGNGTVNYGIVATINAQESNLNLRIHGGVTDPTPPPQNPVFVLAGP